MNPKNLQRLAQATGGIYVEASKGGNAGTIVSLIEHQLNKALLGEGSNKHKSCIIDDITITGMDASGSLLLKMKFALKPQYRIPGNKGTVLKGTYSRDKILVLDSRNVVVYVDNVQASSKFSDVAWGINAAMDWIDKHAVKQTIKIK